MQIRHLILCLFTTAIFQASAATIKVACIGDSITAGAGSSASKDYPTVLGTLLGSGYQVTNFGVSGTTMLGPGFSGSAFVAQGTFGTSNTFQPAIVVIMLGTNDSKPVNWVNKDQFEADTRDLVLHYATLVSKPQVYLCLPCPVYGVNGFMISGPVVQDEIIPILRRVAISTGTPLIDVNTNLSGHAAFFPDLVHPNDTGYAILAQTVKDAITLGAPSALSATVSSATQVDLAWTDGVTTETGFSIERKIVGGTYAKIGSVAANTVVFSDTTTAPLTQYVYRVHATNAAGESPYTNEFTVTTPDALPLAPTSATAVTASVSQIDLSWTDNASNETGFAIERKIGAADFVQIGTAPVNAITYSDKGLAIATQYAYRIRAVNTAGNSDYSNEASTTTFSGASAPTLTDSDGDGFSDALETAAGTSPLNAVDTPMGGALAGTPQPIANAKLSIKLNFAKGGKDSVTLAGLFILPAGFSSAQQKIAIDIGGVARVLTLGDRGSVKTADANVSVKGAGKTASLAKLSIALTKGDFVTAFADEGLVNQSTSAPVTVRFSIVFANTFYQGDLALQYKAKAGKTGAAK